jgi:hypothetical protein
LTTTVASQLSKRLTNTLALAPWPRAIAAIIKAMWVPGAPVTQPSVSSRSNAGSDGLQSEKALHGLEISVAVEQGVTAPNTNGANNEVHRLADRDTAAAQESVVRGRPDRQLRMEQRCGAETPQ